MPDSTAHAARAVLLLHGLAVEVNIDVCVQETDFCGTGEPSELFASTQIDERLPLQRISGRCTVSMASRQDRAEREASNADYICTYVYNHREDVLSKLPAC